MGVLVIIFKYIQDVKRRYDDNSKWYLNLTISLISKSLAKEKPGLKVESMDNCIHYLDLCNVKKWEVSLN